MLKGLGTYWLRHRWQWWVALLTSLLAVACALTVPRLLGWAIDDLRTGIPPGARVPRYAALILVSALGAAGSAWLMRRAGAVASRQIAYEVRRDLFQRLCALDPAYYHRVRTGDLMNRFTGDLGAVQEMLGFATLQGVNTAFTLVMALALMMTLSVRLGLIVLGVFPLVITLLAVMLRTISKRYAAAQEQQSTIAAKAQENFSGIRVVKGYAVEDRELQSYQALNAEYRRRMLRLARVEGPLWATVGLLMNAVFVAVLVFGSRQLLQDGANATLGGLTLGGFVTFTTYVFQLSWPMLAVGMVSNIIQRGIVSWRRLYEVLTVEPTLRDEADVDRSVRALQGDVRFENVSVEIDHRKLLDKIDLHIPAGQVLGITGRTGSGKTLLASLLGRLLDPTSGRIVLDGKDLRSVPLEVLRGHLGVVPQEPFLFSDTLTENIAFGLPESLQTDRDPQLDPELIRWAAQVAGLDGDIEMFPQKYQTILGERGVTLSGGQRQRTALARALAKKPRILVLDDALSAVDTETESRILSQLKTVLRGRTVLLISHRVSTLRHADRVIVLDQGRIAEQGSHEELLAHGGLYASVERTQRLAQALEAQPAALSTVPAVAG